MLIEALEEADKFDPLEGFRARFSRRLARSGRATVRKTGIPALGAFADARQLFACASLSLSFGQSLHPLSDPC